MPIVAMLGALIIGIVITLVVCYFLPKEKVRAANQALDKEENEARLRIKELDNEYLKREKELEQSYQQRINTIQTEYNELTTEQEKVKAQIQDEKINWEREKSNANLELIQQTKQLEIEVRGLEERRNNIIQTLENEAKESGEIFKTQQIEIAKEQIETAKREMQNEYDIATENAKQTYLDTLADMMAEITKNYGIKYQEFTDLLAKIAEAQSKANAAIEVNKRAEMERQQKDFYRLQLLDIDIEEIQRIRSIEPYLRDKEPLNKVIWKVYYEKPYTDLIGRVVGVGRKTGIYKITNIDNGMCYIGQAVDIADRWKQHIRRGIGADPPTRNKLYPAMLSIGVENFTFEIIEECASKDLNSREDYWQSFYHAKDFGYSIK